MKRDCFSSYHPIINFLYFVIVIGCSMFLRHPVFLVISCVGGVAYDLYLRGKKAAKAMLWMLPIFLISALVNPLFNHKGVTVLWRFPSGNVLTMEAIVYGIFAGVMLVTVLKWFSCYQCVMTSDKFIYLFGKMIPALSLVLSMVFRFVPRFETQIKKVSDAQKCIGRDVTNGNAFSRAKHGMKILSIMTTWALENSVDTADSMKARGYGLRGRTTFSIYRFDTRDWIASLLLGSAGLIVIGAIALQRVYFVYYPMLQGNALTWDVWFVYILYSGICLFPLLVNLLEDIKWHYLKSEI